MTPHLMDLAKRAVACKHWRWIAGMQVRRWDSRDKLWRMTHVSLSQQRETFWLHEGWIPDLYDPATTGCFVSMLREVWVQPDLCAVIERDGEHVGKWVVIWRGNAQVADRKWYGTLEAEALVAALEAA